ncbi:MAG: hypothetical protein BWX84_02744 [Verrucomicrobia bacterium ADurb.Bin118]|jgi:hypothetical protein|nr:MAG: hypothetical protein BWX84_02744 [Verrucomicrobia bacterium ADurb.Bin118]
MPTIGQKAEQVSLEGRPCTVILKDGRRIQCERVVTVSPALVATHSGTIDVLCSGQTEQFYIDDIQDIQ